MKERILNKVYLITGLDLKLFVRELSINFSCCARGREALRKVIITFLTHNQPDFVFLALFVVILNVNIADQYDMKT